MFNEILYYSKLFLSTKVSKYKRSIYNSIDFNEKMIGLKGAKGVGKTTIIKQYLKTLPSKEVLYISLDNPLYSATPIIKMVEEAYKRGIKVIAIDEIHYHKDFEQHLKSIYDFFDIKVMFSGSSAIALSSSDLSRRAVVYDIPILSFREFLEFKEKINLPSFELKEILKKHHDIGFEIIENIKPLKYFDEYLDFGAYPFFLKSSKESYILKLTEVVNKTIESDLLYIFNIDVANRHLLKKLLITLCQNPPGSFNITALSKEIGINTRTLYNYIEALNRGKLINLLYYNKKGNALFQKPDKILLENPNLFNILCLDKNQGAKRESFFVSQLYKHNILYSKKGDYLIDGMYLFEIGGKNKGFEQIKDVEKSFVVADDMEIGFRNKIPLWLFGFLY